MRQEPQLGQVERSPYACSPEVVRPPTRPVESHRKDELSEAHGLRRFEQGHGIWLDAVGDVDGDDGAAVLEAPGQTQWVELTSGFEHPLVFRLDVLPGECAGRAQEDHVRHVGGHGIPVPHVPHRDEAAV